MDRDTTVGEIGSKLSNRHADFDVRNYGYSKLSNSGSVNVSSIVFPFFQSSIPNSSNAHMAPT